MLALHLRPSQPLTAPSHTPLPTWHSYWPQACADPADVSTYVLRTELALPRSK